MRGRVLIIDTTILCVWLRVPGKDTCGTDEDRWDWRRVDDVIAKEISSRSTLVLPLATIIETGNHISQAGDRRFQTAALADLMNKAADQVTPWAAFTDQNVLWTADALKQLARDWPTLAAWRLSIGDATIKTVAEHYAQMDYAVEILTGDAGLKAYQPTTPPLVPRRRQRAR